MEPKRLFNGELRLLSIIWANEPVASGELVRLCQQELGYVDELIDAAEVFGAWIIEGPQSIKDEFPVDRAGLPIRIVDNVDPYKKRKVRILNGAHTAMVLGAYLAGKDIVRDCMQDDVIKGYMNRALDDEIIPVSALKREGQDKLLDIMEQIITSDDSSEQQ